MKLNVKYYLRGLGLGIVVTAVIMCILNSGGDEMTDAEIIARAKQLGMIEDTMLTDGLNNGGQGEDSPSDEGQDGDGAGVQTDDDENTDNGGAEPEGLTLDTEAQTAGDGEQEKTKPLLPDSWTGVNTVEAAETVPQGEEESGSSDAGQTEAQDEVTVFPKVLVISSGEGSYTVSKKLAQIGAVESAEDFDTYLCENGYDKKIRAGTYTIPVDATDEEMAKIVTGSKSVE